MIIINVCIFVALGVAQVLIDISGGVGKIDIQRVFFGLPMHLDKLIYKPWTFLTYMFIHDGFWHIFGNMLFMYIFGRILSDHLGGSKVIKLYVLGALFGAVLYLTVFPVLLQLLNPGVDISSLNPNLVGASAGVFAIVFGTAILVPDYTIYLILLGPVKIKYIALFYIISFVLGLSSWNSGGELAHIGGALIGVFYIRQLKKGRDYGEWVIKVLDFVKSFFVKSPNIKVTYKREKAKTTSKRGSTPRNSGNSNDTTSQDEIDAILDKISEKGYESLSKDEKQKLFNASKK